VRARRSAVALELDRGEVFGQPVLIAGPWSAVFVVSAVRVGGRRLQVRAGGPGVDPADERVGQVVAVRRVRATQRVLRGADQAVVVGGLAAGGLCPAVGRGQHLGERDDLGEDRCHEQRALVAGGHEQVQAPLPPVPEWMGLGAKPQVDADARGGGGGVERAGPAVATFGLVQPPLRGAQFGHGRNQMDRRVVAGWVGWADPVPVPGAQISVVGEQPPHREALVPHGAPGTVVGAVLVEFRHRRLR
jgi:hypothetical protein